MYKRSVSGAAEYHSLSKSKRRHMRSADKGILTLSLCGATDSSSLFHAPKRYFSWRHLICISGRPNLYKYTETWVTYLTIVLDMIFRFSRR